MHVGDQVPESEPFAKATKVCQDELVARSRCSACFDLINVGGGNSGSLRKYDDENGDPLKDNMAPVYRP